MKDDLEKAIEFANSGRGQYIMSQALAVAIDTLEKVEPPRRENSNIDDMKFILENLYPTFAALHRDMIEQRP